MSERDLPTRLRAGLAAAMKERRREDARVLRSALAAIANAEAVPGDGPGGVGSAHVAGSVAGAGASDVPRRELDAAAVTAIIEREIHERVLAADDYERLGRVDEAIRLRAEADMLRGLVEAAEPF